MLNHPKKYLLRLPAMKHSVSLIATELSMNLALIPAYAGMTMCLQGAQASA